MGTVWLEKPQEEFTTTRLAVMRILAAISVLALGANALVGPSGIVSPDGKNIQFSSGAEFDNLLYAGPSGVITEDGNNIQLTADQQSLYSNLLPKDAPVAAPVDPEPSVRATLTNEENDNAAVIGPSGIVNKDGVNVQFDAAPTAYVLLDGPSGIVMSDGTLIQKKVKRSLPLIGPSGMIDEDGNQIQFDGSPGLAVTTKLSKAEKENAAVIGPSGIVNFDGVNVQFDKLPEPEILLEGPSGYVMTDGSLRQKVVKRSVPLIGPSGMLTADGRQVQFTAEEGRARSTLTPEQNAKAVVVGPSGIVNFDGVMSDGTLVQKRAKRHVIGPSAIITDQGELIQLPAGVTVVGSGPSGFVLSNGQNIQLKNVN